MYQVEGTRAALHSRKGLLSGRLTVGRTVLLLGVTSFFTDISSEMVSATLPLYIVYVLGLSPLAFGALDGLYYGSTALVRIASGALSDRRGRHKEIATAGYAFSALTKPLFLVVGGSLGGLSAVVFADRVGKGIRTSPRDAMISLTTPADELAAGFGVHRALDTAGAMFGPLLAFFLLALSPQSFDPIFIVSFCFAVIGVGVIVCFVRNPVEPEAEAAKEPLSLRAMAAVARTPGLGRLCIAVSALSLFTVGDAFVYLALDRSVDVSNSAFPLLFVGTALVYTLLAIPVGRLADRVGRMRVFVAGYGCLLAVYGVLLAGGEGILVVFGSLLLLGTYYAATDGVLMAIASSMLPRDLRGTGLSTVTTAYSLARFGSSLLFGAIWYGAGISAALACFAVGLFGALCLSRGLLGRVARA